MVIRFSSLAAASTLAVVLTACSAQPGETSRAAAVSQAAVPAAQPAPPASPSAGTPTPASAATAQTTAAAEAPPSAAPGTPVANQEVSRATPLPSTEASDAPKPASTTGSTAALTDAAPAVREITIPAGTPLHIDLRTSLASNTSHVEDRVSAALRQPVTVRGVEALPVGTLLVGHVTEAAQSARVKGRGRIAFRFTSLDAPGEGGRTAIRTASIIRLAPATKKEDAAKIGGGAAGGALIGGLLGGGSGAAKGAAIGGAAGTGVVLSTRGRDVHVPAGTNLIVRLQEAITVRLRR